MEVLSFWALLVHLGSAGPIVLEISCVLVRLGESEVLLKILIGGVNLAVATAVLTSRGMETSLPVRITSLGVRKMRAPLCAASVTISLESTV